MTAVMKAFDAKIPDSLPVLKEVKPSNFLYFRTEAYVHQLLNFIPVARDLVKEAVSYNLHITGPIHWHYFGFTGDESKSFTLEVALPVSDVVPEYDGNFHFKRTEPFRCAALTHEGGWDTLPGSYEKLMRFIAGKHLEPSEMTREIYVNTDFRDPDANVTVIQVGIR
jgi:effector-binding domain-containing protein